VEFQSSFMMKVLLVGYFDSATAPLPLRLIRFWVLGPS
jgi:hypothetical protein